MILIKMKRKIILYNHNKVIKQLMTKEIQTMKIILTQKKCFKKKKICKIKMIKMHL